MAAEPRSPPPGAGRPARPVRAAVAGWPGLDGQFGLTRDGAGFTDSQAIAAIAASPAAASGSCTGCSSESNASCAPATSA